MRILLAHNSLYYPSYGGGDKSNRLLMEALAARGHAVRVVARIEHFGAAAHDSLLSELAARGIHPHERNGTGIEFQTHRVDVRVLTCHGNLRTYFATQVEAFDPDIILASTDDPAHLMLESALRAPRARVVYLVRATIALPFGPDSGLASPFQTEALQQSDGVVAVGEYVAQYTCKWGGLEAVHLPISLLDPGEPPDLGRFTNRYVSMVNPCAVKGISIFVALAERFPDVEFAAVPTWGATAADLAALRAHPNIHVIPPADDMDGLFRQTRVTLVPSLWAEARSRVILEAMARGIPVMASNVGGLAEAMLGVDYLLPVNAAVHYRPEVDELMVPVADIPTQDIEPWAAVLRRLLTDPAHYAELSARSRTAALGYARTLNVLPFESYLRRVLDAPRKPRTRPAHVTGSLSNERRRLLARRATALARKQLPGTDVEVLWDGMWIRRVGAVYFPDPELFLAHDPDWLRWIGRAAKYTRDAEDYWFHVYPPRAGDVIVDIGAGRGEDALAFSRAVGPAGAVWAIEPHPVSFHILRRFCELNRLSNVTALNYACLDRRASVDIETLPAWESNYIRDGVRGAASYPVPGIRFDDLAAEHAIDRIDFLKMNIEGGERAALPGCREALGRARYTCVAAHDFRADRGEGDRFRTLDFVREFLAEAGFEIVLRDDPRYYVPYHVHGVRRV